MIITQIIEVGINVQNAIGIYTDDNNIMQILIDRYEGRCFNSIFIKKIEKILRTSECIINQEGSPGFGIISVICEVTAVVYAVGEIINGCVVKNRDKNGIIVCSTDIASIMLAAHPALESVTKGQIISVRVGAARYNTTSKKIAVNAIPYLFTKEIIVYKVNGHNVDKSLLTNVLERIDFEENEKKKMNEKAWNTFDQILYAYKEPQSAPNGVKLIDLKDILKSTHNDVKYLSRDPRINLSTSNVYGYNNIGDNPQIKLRTDLSFSTVLLLLLEDYCAHLRTIREMVNIYSTEKLLADHKNLWQIFRKNKL